jgi:hypothetical protein
MTATQEFVVPKSIPITLLILLTSETIFIRTMLTAGGARRGPAAGAWQAGVHMTEIRSLRRK